MGWNGMAGVRPSLPPIQARISIAPLGWNLRKSSITSGRSPSGSDSRIRMALMYCQVQSTTGNRIVVPGRLEICLFQPR